MSRRILIIDDEDNIRRVMRFTLEADGYEVVEAPDGAKGMELFGSGSQIDAVLVDQKMPGLDGLETMRGLRERDAAACVIMVTAFASIELAVDAMKAGASDFLRKPMTPETLRGAVAAALSKRPPRPGSVVPPTTLSSEREIWTVNGFFIVPLPAMAGAPPGEHRFHVRHAQRGSQGDVTVSVDVADAARIAQLTSLELPLSGDFWHGRAELTLIEHLFREASVPETGRLTTTRVPGSAIDSLMTSEC